MSKIGQGIIWVVLASLTGAAWAEPLTVQQAVEQALAHNPGIERQRQHINSETLERSIAQAHRLPELDLQAGLTHYSDPALAWPIHQPGAFPPFDQDISNIGINVRLPLYTGGRLLAAVDLADERSAMAQHGLQASEQELTFNVISSFGKTLQLQHLREAMEHRIRRLEAQVEDVRKRFRSGRAAELDVARIQTQLSEARYELATLEQGVSNTLNLLTTLMGRSQAPQQLAALADIPLNATTGIESWIEQALTAHPSIRQAQANIRASEQRVAMAKGERLPQFSLVGNSRYLATSDGDGQDEWQIGVQMSLPLYDGSARSDKVTQSQIARQMAQLDLQELRDRVAYQVREAHAAVATAQLQIEVAEQGLSEAEEVLRIETLRYKTGTSTITDLLGAEAAHWNARAKLTQARYDLVIYKSQLLKASGGLTRAVFESTTSP